MKKIWRFITCQKKYYPNERTFYVGSKVLSNDSEYEYYKYPKNIVLSSKYTVLNFLPKCLFEQFQRIANFYFILVMLVMLLIDSPVSPLTTVIPIVFVILVSVVKQGIEDILRHRSDNEVNKRQIEVIRDNRFMKINSADIVVGDIVKCNAGKSFPCDLILLSSSEENGECTVTTANLDGETSLKAFLAPELTQNLRFEDVSSLPYIKVTCTHPIEDLYSFQGILEVTDGENDKGKQVSLSAKNLLLRAAVMKNTASVIGVATYTGPDTKLSLNSKGKKVKYSQVELKLNAYLILYFIILFVMSLTCMIILYISRLSNSDYKNSWYVPFSKITPWKTTQEFFGFIIVYNYLVPISLYVTIELQKFIGAFTFRFDLTMYDALADQPARVNTSDLNEELGQITYLFSDKTGTLTENDMQFRRCSVAGVRYIDVDGKLCRMTLEKNGMDEELLQPYSPEISEFLLIMSLCHTVRVERSSSAGENPGKDGGYIGPLADKRYISDSGLDYEYHASSPDEKAFVEAARKYGVIYHGILDGYHCVTMSDRKEMLRFRVLEVFEFDSDRKRMSAIVEYPDKTVRLLCKGAENSMFEKANSKSQKSTSITTIMDHLYEYAEKGLRTLVFGYRILDDGEADRIINDIHKSKKSFENSEQLLARCYDKYESELILIGCTGVEDRLQEYVKETLEDLREAGIKVWVLTGDKVETAINISRSAGHIAPYMQEVVLKDLKNPDAALAQLQNELERLEISSVVRPEDPYYLVVDGGSLKHFLLSDLISEFVDLCKQMSTVLCCRMTPLQKAEIVRMIKYYTQPAPITAAIGDGGNDVSMIQEAHLGLGIFGKEGRQAVRASDYALGKFYYARRALLVHGHLFYWRITNLLQYFFYKNMVFIAPQFYFSFFSMHSTETIYNTYILTLFNVTFTTLPILLYGIVEQNIDMTQLLLKPSLYKLNRNNAQMTIWKVIIWNAFGIWHSLVIFFSFYGMTMENNMIYDSEGKANDIYMFGLLIFLSVWIIVIAKLYLISQYFNVVILIGFLIVFIGNTLIFIIITVQVSQYTFYWTFFSIFANPSFWFQTIITVLIALTPDIIYKLYSDYKLKQKMNVPIVKRKPPRRRVSYAPTRQKSMIKEENDNYDMTDNNNNNDLRPNRFSNVTPNDYQTTYDNSAFVEL